MFKLLVQVGTKIEQEFLIEGKSVKIGSSDDNDLVLDDRRIAASHAEITKKGDDYYLTSATPQTASFMNAQRVISPTPIQHDDIINLGKYSLVCFDEEIGTLPGEQVVIGEARDTTALGTGIGPAPTGKPPAEKRSKFDLSALKPLHIAALAAIIVLLLALLLMPSGDSEDRAGIFRTAVEQYKAGQLDAALARVGGYLRDHDNDEEFLRLRNRILRDQRVNAFNNRAEQDLRPNDPDALAAAASLLDSALALVPDHPRALSLKDSANILLATFDLIQEASARMGRNDLAGARSVLSGILSTRPGHAEATRLMALIDDMEAEAAARASKKPVRRKASKPRNRSPYVGRIRVAKSSLEPGASTTVQVNASDPDGDRLRIRWSAKSGRVSGSGKRATYKAPADMPTSGRDVVAVSVSDGRNKAQVRKTTITLASSEPAPPTLSSEVKLKARELYLVAYKNEVDYQNYLKAIAIYEQILELAPDPKFEYYKKAKARLERLRK